MARTIKTHGPAAEGTCDNDSSTRETIDSKQESKGENSNGQSKYNQACTLGIYFP